MSGVTAFVPLKGHSQRVPGKNLRAIAGRPLFHWVVRTLVAAERVGDVVIDSDSDEILESAAAAFPGVRLVRRRPDLCGDDVPMNALIEACFGLIDGDVLLQTHATNPLLRPETVDRAIDAFFADAAATSLFSVTELRTRLYWEDLTPINHDPAELRNTQDLPVVLEENSNIYLVTRAGFAAAGHRITAEAMAFPMDPLEAVDIDTEADFALAEALLRSR